MAQHQPKTILILGAYASGAGYPNTTYFIEALNHDQRFNLINLGYEFMPGKQGSLDKLSRQSRFSRIIQAIKLVLLCTLSFLRYLFNRQRRKNQTWVYLPYPGLLTAWLFIFIPKRYRPRIIIDAFISIYDTSCNDRKLLNPDSWLARRLFSFEKQVYSLSRHVIVDTQKNALYFQQLFNSNPEKFSALPLATDEQAYAYNAYKPAKGRFRVTFFGTFVPLQGVDVLAKAMVLLKHHENIDFTLIGQGQTAPEVEKIFQQAKLRPNWIKQWINTDELVSHLTDTDLCLGIFGETAKAKRVIPYKIYLAASLGRPILTACGCMEELGGEAHCPWVRIDFADSTSLAEKIKQLAGQPSQLSTLAQNTYRHYQAFLSNAHKLDQFDQLLDSE